MWHKFVGTYRYDGNVEVYIATQQQVLATKFTHEYPGGALAFAEAYETAFINIDNAQYHSTAQPFYSDTNKRSTFLTNFSNEENVHFASTLDQTTDTWPELMTELRKSLARQRNVATTTASANAHLTNHQTFYAFIAAIRDQNWNVGEELWKCLSLDQKRALAAMR